MPRAPIAILPAFLCALIWNAGQAAEVLLVGGMEDGGVQPTGWSLWKGGGEAVVERDTTEHADGTASLRLTLSGTGAYAGVSANLAPAATGQLRINGQIRISGDGISECLVALRGFNEGYEQIAWQTVFERKAASDGWVPFTAEAAVPAGTTRTVSLIARGSGTVWLDALRVEDGQ